MTSLLPPSFRGSLPSSRCHPSESLELAGCTAGDPPVQMSRATTVEVALILRAMPDGESSGRPAWSPLVWGMASRSLVSSATRCHPAGQGETRLVGTLSGKDSKCSQPQNSRRSVQENPRGLQPVQRSSASAHGSASLEHGPGRARLARFSGRTVTTKKDNCCNGALRTVLVKRSAGCSNRSKPN